MLSGKRFLLSGNSIYLNRGSEAIVRGTARILRSIFGAPVIVSSEIEHFPYVFPPEKDKAIVHHPLLKPKPWSLRWLFFNGARALRVRTAAYKYYVNVLRKEIRFADVVLSLGGDSYIGRPFLHIALNELALEESKPVFLWGASVGPFVGGKNFQDYVFAHLRRLTGIFLRESVSRQYLSCHGVCNNVSMIEDPAFAMLPEKPKYGEMPGGIPVGAIGLCLSRLFLSRTSYQTHHEVGVEEVVDRLRDRFGRPIVLVPHCVVPWDDDHALLSGVLARNASRWHNVMCLPRNLCAAKLKWAISQMDVLIGARTHSTIASFGTCTPTLSLVYSFKGKGLNKDLFGSLDYAVTTDEFRPESVVSKTEQILADSDNIRSCLRSRMKQVMQGCFYGGEMLRKAVWGI
ncbi:MAG: polysaccharide pyruvyl transferase family protein [Planctomycetota bacterium]|jgi:polysaccharide pyruvyl transferase WcaK-like protein